ncbi:MAG: hypothetical protein M3462_09655, partial [Chloroflexota bacterium]|nr:hypothetical protein [Chloroflexota bacterium]
MSQRKARQPTHDATATSGESTGEREAVPNGVVELDVVRDVTPPVSSEAGHPPGQPPRSPAIESSPARDAWETDEAAEEGLDYRRRYRGLIGVRSKVPVRDRAILSLVYTPG